MMRHPYPESYVDEIAETQGRLFARAQSDRPGCDGEDFVRAYMRGSTRAALDSGDAYLANLDSGMLMDHFVKADSYRFREGEPLAGFAAEWIGDFYARCQWETGRPSSEIASLIPVDWLRVAYRGLHDLDMRVAVEKVLGGLAARPKGEGAGA